MLSLKQKMEGDISRLESIAGVGFFGGELENLSYSL
jgi:hypothetical protein